MAPTLHDVTFLTGLPCTGFLLAVHDVQPTWRTEFHTRFQGMLPPNTSYRESSKRMAEDAPEYMVKRHFEGYLLWLFGWVLFLWSHDDSVDKHMICYAHELADLEVEAIQPYAWGSTVLCAKYRALCDASHRVQDSSILSGCPLLLQLCPFDRFQIGRPQLDQGAYSAAMYADDDDVDRPTMGTVWCHRRVTFTPITTHTSYPDYVAMFDQLTDDRVIWTPNTPNRVYARAP